MVFMKLNNHEMEMSLGSLLKCHVGITKKKKKWAICDGCTDNFS